LNLGGGLPAQEQDFEHEPLAAQEQEARAVAHRVLLRRLGAPVVYAREELLEHAVIAQYEALRRTRRI